MLQLNRFFSSCFHCVVCNSCSFFHSPHFFTSSGRSRSNLKQDYGIVCIKRTSLSSLAIKKFEVKNMSAELQVKQFKKLEQLKKVRVEVEIELEKEINSLFNTMEKNYPGKFLHFRNIDELLSINWKLNKNIAFLKNYGSDYQ